MSLHIRVPSLSSYNLEVINGLVDKVIIATTVSTASSRKCYRLISCHSVERAENSPGPMKCKPARHL